MGRRRKRNKKSWRNNNKPTNRICTRVIDKSCGDIFLDVLRRMRKGVDPTWTDTHIDFYRDKWEQENGLKIPFGWVIHHIDRNRENNDISNLICLPGIFHSEMHKLMMDHEIGNLNRAKIRELYFYWAGSRNFIYNNVDRTKKIKMATRKLLYPSYMGELTFYNQKKIAEYPERLMD